MSMLSALPVGSRRSKGGEPISEPEKFPLDLDLMRVRYYFIIDGDNKSIERWDLHPAFPRMIS